jgi:hypothetical protein
MVAGGGSGFILILFRLSCFLSSPSTKAGAPPTRPLQAPAFCPAKISCKILPSGLPAAKYRAAPLQSGSIRIGIKKCIMELLQSGA